jgi:hypothetical protein
MAILPGPNPNMPFIDTLYNFHWIREGEAARSSQAYFGGLGGLMRRHGLRAVVNLRGENSDLSWWRYERKICTALGAVHIDAMLDSRHLPTRAMLQTLVTAFDTAPRPFLVKCSGGHDRTAFAAALLILHRDGWSAMAAAEAQFDPGRYGHVPKKHQRWLKPFLAFAAQDADGQALAAWIDQTYDPTRLTAWLDACGLKDGHKGIFRKPTRSPFQL